MLLIGFKSSKWRKPHTLVSHRVTIIQTKQQNECLVALGIRMILWEMVGLGPLHLEPPTPQLWIVAIPYVFFPFHSEREGEAPASSNAIKSMFLSSQPKIISWNRRYDQIFQWEKKNNFSHVLPYLLMTPRSSNFHPMVNLDARRFAAQSLMKPQFH